MLSGGSGEIPEPTVTVWMGEDYNAEFWVHMRLYFPVNIIPEALSRFQGFLVDMKLYLLSYCISVAEAFANKSLSIS